MIAKFQGGASQIRDSTPQSSLPSMEFGREICCSLANAEQHEWLVTNGIGGYASGTVAGLTTRRYHGLLIAALKPPLGRTPLVAKIAVVDACARHLLTSYGLRSLASGHANYQGHYAGGPRERDAAYHQGTVWGWLLGPFVLAHLRVYNDPVRAASFLEPFANHLRSYGLGTAGEIFDGDAPFAPRGCIAQAWTVGELLRAWTATAAAATGRTKTLISAAAGRGGQVNRAGT